MTTVAQAYFLGCTLGDDGVTFYGEPQGPGIRLIPPACFFAEDAQSYGLGVSVDTLPELHDEVAESYLATLAKRSRRFLSVNHETLSPRTVREIAIAQGWASVMRYPAWMRRGYVEELFKV